jgi:hypothetical protein
VKIYCQTNKQLISYTDCVIRDSCSGCGHLSKAKEYGITAIKDVTPEEERDARHFQTNSHFSDEFISDIPRDCTRDYFKRENKAG